MSALLLLATVVVCYDFFLLFSIRVLLFLLLVGVFVVDFSKNQNKREMKVKKKIET